MSSKRKLLLFNIILLVAIVVLETYLGDSELIVTLGVAVGFSTLILLVDEALEYGKH